jgi:hypothetical protein
MNIVHLLIGLKRCQRYEFEPPHERRPRAEKRTLAHCWAAEQRTPSIVCSMQCMLEGVMPYTRPIRRFYLTPPSVVTFVISVLLALIAVFATYGHLVLFKGISSFVILLIAYLVLLVGVLFRGV